MKGDLLGPSPGLVPIMATEATPLGLLPHKLCFLLRPTKGRGSRGESIQAPKSYKGPRGMGGVA
jgi:hypothetical protein